MLYVGCVNCLCIFVGNNNKVQCSKVIFAFISPRRSDENRAMTTRGDG